VATNMRRIALLGAAISAALVLGACRDEEQGRPYQYTTNYAGTPDSTISPQAEQALRDRVRFQRGLDSGAPSGGGLAGSGDVRPPAVREDAADVRPPQVNR